MTTPQPALRDATLEVADRIATLTLNRPDVLNALTGTALADDIVAVADWVNRADEVSVLILTGAGKAFSAGGNVKDMATRSNDFAGSVAEVAERYRRGIQRIPLAMQGIEVPVIAAVNGAAIGAGCDLACFADLRLAADNARFGETFVNLGIVPGDGGAWFLQRLVGYQRAFELTLGGRLIDAAEAKSIGLVLDVVPAAELLSRARELAATFAAKPAHAVRLTKRLMKMAQRLELPDFLALTATFQGICHNEPAHLEAVEALLAKMR